MKLVFRVTLPQHRLDPAAFEAAIQRAQIRIAGDIIEDYGAVTSTWSTPVKMEETEGRHTRTVSTTDKRMLWTDRGTKPHVISPKVAGGSLRFKVGGAPKTHVRELSSTVGMVGTNWKMAKSVNHPGTEARWFSEMIAKKRAPIYRDYMQEEINKAATT
jgi:hypothetical protein